MSGRRRRRRRGCPPVRQGAEPGAAARHPHPGTRRRSVAEARLPSEPDARIGGKQFAGTQHQIVEVHRTANMEQIGIRRQCGPRFVGRRAALDLPGRKERVQLRRLGRGGRRRLGQHAPARGAEDGKPIGDDRLPLAGVEENLARKGVEGANLDRARGGHGAGQPSLDPRAEVQRGIPVEGDHANALGGDATRQQHGQPRHHRGRLATAGGGDDLRRTVGQCRGRPLLGIERIEDRLERGRRKGLDRHRSMIASPAYQPFTGGLPVEAVSCRAPPPD